MNLSARIKTPEMVRMAKELQEKYTDTEIVRLGLEALYEKQNVSVSPASPAMA